MQLSADSLRSQVPAVATAMPRVIAVTSGKGGVGKSVLSANLGVSLAQQGRKVLLIDADIALANLDLMLGVSARATIRELFNSGAALDEIIVKGPLGVSLLPACSGDAILADMDDKMRLSFFSAIDSLEDQFDTVVIDTGAGIGSNATAFAAAAQQVLVVVTPDPASMADAYAMIKVLSQRCGVKQIHIVVNMAANPKEADRVVQRLLSLVDRFLQVSVIPMGFVYRDDAVSKSVRSCQPLVLRYPQSSVALSVKALAQRLMHEPLGEEPTGGPKIFWKRLMGLQSVELGQ